MTLKKIYCYLFYTLYRFYEKSPSKWWSDCKATLSLMILELWLLLSLMVYYMIIFKKGLMPDNYLIVVGITVLVILSWIKYIVFENQDRWKQYIKEFSNWPKKKNKIGTLISWGCILIIISNLVFSLYLYSTVKK